MRSVAATPTRCFSPSIILTSFVALWCVGACNPTFWREVRAVHAGNTLHDLAFLATAFLIATLYAHLLLSLLAFRWVGKPWLVFVLLAASVTSYFTSTFGTRLDAEMIRNVLETDVREAGELVGWRLIAHVAVFGALPALVVLHPRLCFGTLRQEVGTKAFVVAASALLALPVAAVFYADYAALMRNHRELRHVFAPANFLNGAWRELRERWKSPDEVQIVGQDARLREPASARPQLLLLVLGETARAANFSLGGYERETNPELARRDVVYFSEVRAAGTSTAASLPPLFSDLGRDGGATRAKARESLLDVLEHAGVDVLWRDNSSGCKGICDRVEFEDLSHASDAGLCRDGECWDEILLGGLQRRLDAAGRDLVVVLHMHGSHGPGYHLRHPPEFARFQPECTTLELGDCEHEALVNAYDNTILYTDHVLALAIDLLERNRALFDGGLLYVSDHGESLGERGIYLHGLPYWIAPEVQTHVPMLVWASPELRARRGLDWDALAAHRSDPLSHDNVYHSVLGLLGVRASVYREELDVFRPRGR